MLILVEIYFISDNKKNMSLMFAKVALSVRSSLANVAKRSFHCTSKNLGKFF